MGWHYNDCGSVRPPPVKLTGHRPSGERSKAFDATTKAGRCAEKRLREEEITRLTTVRDDGQPQSVPLWFLWDGETFLIDFFSDTRS